MAFLDSIICYELKFWRQIDVYIKSLDKKSQTPLALSMVGCQNLQVIEFPLATVQ